MKITHALAFFSLLLPLGAVSGHAAPASENWENFCAKCHAADGTGATKIGKKLKLKDYTDAKVQDALKDDVLIKAIADGVSEGGKEKMKGFKDAMSEAEIKDLVAHIRKMKK
ncbi:MAG: cytochrome c [Opitutae bacterium]|nr:cytochrome c [Opitutae bacterium]